MSWINVKVVTDSGVAELDKLTEIGLQEALYCAERLIGEIEEALHTVREKESRGE